MKEIISQKDDKNTVKIVTPWLKGDEASKYLGISLSEFKKTVVPVTPCKGFGNRKRFNVHDLDEVKPKLNTKKNKKLKV